MGSLGEKREGKKLHSMAWKWTKEISTKDFFLSLGVFLLLVCFLGFFCLFVFNLAVPSLSCGIWDLVP